MTKVSDVLITTLLCLTEAQRGELEPTRGTGKAGPSSGGGRGVQSFSLIGSNVRHVIV